MTENFEKRPNFFKYIFNLLTLRKIQFDIVTVFVFLISLSSLFIIFFSYSKNSQEILKISKLTMQEASDGLLYKIDGVTHEATLLTKISRAFVQNPKDVSPNNKELIKYIVDIIRYSDYISTVKIASPEGNLLAAVNLELSKEFTHFYNNPSKEIPKESVYAVRWVDRSQATPSEVWQYLDKQLTVLETETISPTSYDPRNEPWYADTMKMNKLHWSNRYLNTIGEPGITIAGPSHNPAGKESAVVALNLSINLLTDFFVHQHVGTEGASFVLDKDGNLVIPPIKELVSIPQSSFLPLIPGIYKQFILSGQDNFVFEKDQVKYLVFLSRFPIEIENPWTILLMVPFDEFFHSIIATQRQIVIISLIATVLFGILVYFSSRHIGVPVVKLAQNVRQIQHFDFSERPKLRSQIKEIVELETSLDSMRNALRSFERYVPKEIVKVLIEQGREIAVGGEKRDVTVFFSDISDFTTFSEMMPVEKLLDFLTAYFEVFSKVILESEGTIDKYIGDSVMAIWNAPQRVPDHPDRACLSALSCLVASNKQQRQTGNPGWKTRFGLHTGEVIVGNIGTNERMNYTVIGDVVNTTSRLHGVNKIFQTSIIISETLQQKIGTQFLSRPLDTVAVKGRKNKITVYELVGLLKGDRELLATAQQIELCHAFSIAYGRFQEGRFAEAKEHFLALSKQFPEDKPIQIYLEKIQALTI